MRPILNCTRQLWWLAMLVAGVLTLGCDSDTSTSPAGPTSVSGNVNKAPVAGATVAVHALQATGLPAAVVAGPFTTDASGNWTGQIPAGQLGPHVLVATGGSYVDEATGNNVTLAAGQLLYGLLKGSASQVTPLSHATFLGMEYLVSGGATLADAISQATASSQTAFGFDFATTVPSIAATATADAKEYAALLGGLSTLLDGNPALGAFTNTHPVDLVIALCTDMPDGRLDGIDPSGSDIQVPTDAIGTSTAPLPALSANDLSAWLGAANAFAAVDPNLNGISFNTATVWNPSSSGGGGTCAVTFTGTGLSLLPDDCFIPNASQLFDEQFIWDDGIDDVQILAIPVTPGSSAIRTLYVTRPEAVSAVWNQFNGSGIAGASRSGGRLRFVNVAVPELTGGGTTLTLNGELDEPTSAAARR